ncbi:hypothetical protein A3A20_00130 [Candidatus Wolfebacteria bacterium RIFCSPLOWO2_01_FULL_45_19]|uniref:Uncharacterized protein n=1 Tax=Candidatus Wolfebacteria bacterium RIFCSPLOWO2_01_FULL_45_19 TaxID=1802557 RepID=A0A1F8DT42_9BACT|nr:MAG: hypothetical protein UX23_C0007G0034 [Parcubacteria group bacterium GW2011_GWB1_45_9]OGM90978.1 MAG: hypothetical protein A3A20_00130 [Candidatus Wolfebacteria bacterium RIFCSPLOWO2_01_FULL_45_19]
MLDGEKNIIQRAIRGESSAFGQLYDHYMPMIYRFVLLKVGRREEAEDLTHQVFLSALQNISGYKHLGHPFSSWLYKIARNSIIDNARTKKETIPLYDLDMEPHIEPAIEKTLDLNKEFNSAMKAIGQLNEEQQNVVIMKFIEGFSHKEIAEALDKNEGAIRTIQHRAIIKLKKLLSV